MTRRGFALGRQIAAGAALAALALCLSGDRTSAAGVPATVYGQDPLEVLELKVRPNVIIVLDSSGSMAQTTTGSSNPRRGDHPRSKMLQAKKVLRQIVQNNQDKVSFMMSQYLQVDSGFDYQTRPNLNNNSRRSCDVDDTNSYSCTDAGARRFQYTSTTSASILRALGDTADRGFQSWQDIQAGWNKLYYNEAKTTGGPAVCSATVSATFYQKGSDLATALTTAMNTGASCSPSRDITKNTYTVTYATGTGVFTFAATGPKNFWLPNTASNTIAKALGTLPTTAGIPGNTTTLTFATSAIRKSTTGLRIDTAAANGVLVGDSCTLSGAAPSSLNGGPFAVTSVSSTTRFTMNPPTSGSTINATTQGSVTCTRIVTASTPLSSGKPYTLLKSGTWPAGFGAMAMTSSFADGTPSVTYYQVGASRLWNGETLKVQADGYICGLTSAATQYNPARFFVQTVATPCGADSGSPVTWEYSGAPFTQNSDFCRGFENKVALVPCDLQSPAPTQFQMISPYLEEEFPFNADGTPKYHSWAQDGTWAATTWPAADDPATLLVDEAQGGIRAAGGTPMANSLIDIKTLFGTSATTGLWGAGQAGATTMAGPGPWQITPIKNHVSPKEKTIVLLVTDGNDTCATRTGDGSTDSVSNALKVAYKAQVLYDGIGATPDPASKVQTYVIGYGDSTSPDKMNWIAWGGSGLVAGASNPGTTGTGEAKRWTAADESSDDTVTTSLATSRAACSTCQDAFIAPDAATLASTLQGIIDQGASDGDFNAQQSITESVFEYVDRVTVGTSPPRRLDVRNPSDRYGGIVPTRFVSSFTLPGFKGQLKAYQNDEAGNSVEMWSAGDKLWQTVSNGMNATGCPANAGAGVGALECVLPQLHAAATDATIAASTAKIKRRIYTTKRNGVYCGDASSSATCTFDPTTLMAGTSTERVTLWPPAAGVLPADYTTLGLFDIAMGLPPNAPTAFPPPKSPDPDLYCDAADTTATPKKSYDQCWLEALQRDFKACLGTNLPAGCSSATVNTKMLAARREARDITLAFLAGATTVPVGTGIKRTSAAYLGAPTKSILYKARPWVLADSEMATAAVVTPPSLSEPDATPYIREYQLYRDGTRDANGKNVDPAGNQIRQGFGLTQPDDDQTAASGSPDTRTAVKPAMTVIYAPANDMLHAFRAGPNCSPAFTSYSPLTQNSACVEKGGEELWGFVPYDQLGAVRLRAANEPQGRANHVFMLGRGVRFADVFVPGAVNATIGGVPKSLTGVWRRVLYFGRGIGGKYVTALDVTAPGPYTALALGTVAPVPLWSRGNPDTQNGLSGGTLDGPSADADAYTRMGETWSMPTVAYVNEHKSNPLYVTTRRPDGVDFVLFMGSGYGDPNAAVREGTTHYTLDALSGDVVAAVDVEVAASSYGLTRSGLTYPNAIVANSVSFNRSAFQSVSAKQFNVNPHPWSFVSARVYVGDLHGRLWKILTAFPNVALPAADLGADQPVGTAVALMGEDLVPGSADPPTMIPNIFVTSGAEKRASGPFRSFSLLDAGTDTAAATTGTTVSDGVTTFAPVTLQFARTFDQGVPEASCGYPTEAVFRGTVQPTSAVECDGPLTGSKCDGNLLQRVFFGGTRLSLPNTKFAPPTPLACSTGTYPCRSQFDSILYALGVKTGQAAYDLNASTDDAYRIFRDSRIAAISFQADPDPALGGSRFAADEGLMKGTPKPPPPPGVPPTAPTATANVVLRREPGQPAPSVQYGSTVCQ